MNSYRLLEDFTRSLLALALSLCWLAQAADPVPPQITNIRVSQRAGTFFVDINYDLIDPDSTQVGISIQVSSDGGTTYNVPANTLTGAVGMVSPGRNKFIEWNAGADWANNVTTRGRVRIIADDAGGAPFPAPLPNLVWIKADTFTMGSPPTEVDRYDWEGPQTVVTLTKGFYIGKYEVTQKEYEAVMKTNPSYWKGESLPVEQVTWFEAVDYCAKLTDQERSQDRLPAGYAYRLPTEAQWEYACRAGTTTRFSYGNDPGYTQIGEYAWYWGNSSSQTHPVGLKKPNPWGLHDMHGNVWEWCLDWWSDSLPGGKVTDPLGPNSGSDRVLRGGGWNGAPRRCRSAYRDSCDPSYRYFDFGFRVALVAVP